MVDVVALEEEEKVEVVSDGCKGGEGQGVVGQQTVVVVGYELQVVNYQQHHVELEIDLSERAVLGC